MKMSKITCEICHTKTCRSGSDKRIFMAKFPLDKDRCKKWVAATGNEDLIYVPIEKLHEIKYVCGKHFRLKDFKKKRTQLRKTAVPCIDISLNPITEEMMKEFPLHVARDEIINISLRDHDYCSQEPTTYMNVENVNHSMKRERSGTPERSPLCQENTSAIKFNNTGNNISNPKLTTSIREELNQSIKRKRSSTPEPLTSTPCPERLLEKETINNIVTSPKNQKLIPSSVTQQRRKVRNKLQRRRLEVNKLQTQINQVENISSPVLKSLIDSTINNEKRKPIGHRWIKQNKTVALAIYIYSKEQTADTAKKAQL